MKRILCLIGLLVSSAAAAQDTPMTLPSHVIVDSCSGCGGSGTQYPNGQAQATPTGTVALGYDGANVRALKTDATGAVTFSNTSFNVGNFPSFLLDATYTGRTPAGASPANGESNTNTALSRVGGYNFVFNGSTWDRWTGAISGTVTANQGTSPWVDNVSQFGGTNVVTGIGPAVAGAPRVTASDDNTTGTQTINATTACPAAATTVQSNAGCIVVPIAGRTSVGALHINAAFNGSLVFEHSYDGGTTWSTSLILQANQQKTCSAGVPCAFNDSVTYATDWYLASPSHVRIRCTAFTSGSTSVTIMATRVNSALAVGALANGFDGLTAPLMSSKVGGKGTAAALNPVTACDNQAVINVSSAATTSLVALSGTTKVRVCAYSITNVGAATAPTWKFVYGTGGSCVTGPTDMMGAQSGSTTVGAPTVFNAGDGLGEILSTAAGNALCITTTTTQAQAGWVRYAQY